MSNIISKSYFPQEITRAAGEKAEIGREGDVYATSIPGLCSKGENRIACDGTGLAPSEVQRQLGLKHCS